MIEKIRRALESVGANTYLIRETREETAELFFVRTQREMTRETDVTRYSAVLYRDFEVDGKPMRGEAVATVFTGMTDLEIEGAVREAHRAAGYVKNPWFELPEPAAGAVCEEETDLMRAAVALSEGLFRADGAEDAFVNSAEIFAARRSVRILSSRGADVRYVKHGFKGEFLAQCVKPMDVELYRDFEYDIPDADALEREARALIENARDRARATEAPKAGKYSLILSGKHLATVLSAYVDKASASMVYAKYSDYEIGKSAQGEGVSGEKLNMTLRARAPFSDEGISMVDRALLREGTVQTLYGATRFCRYLGIEPTGMYGSFSLDNGTVPLAEMMREPHIHPVAFSDFQMDAFSGHFAGEIRLAYVFDGETTRVVTGGSVNGSLFDTQGELTFSLEKYRDAEYEGPLAACFPRVSVAGA